MARDQLKSWAMALRRISWSSWRETSLSVKWKRMEKGWENWKIHGKKWVLMMVMVWLCPVPSKTWRLFGGISPTSGSRKYKWRPSKITSSGGVIGTNSKRWYTYDIIIIYIYIIYIYNNIYNYIYIYDISEIIWSLKGKTNNASWITEICAFFKPRCQDESHRVTMPSCRVTSCAECRDCLRSAAKHGSLRSWIPAGWFTKCNLSALAKQIPREKEHVQCFRLVFLVV